MELKSGVKLGPYESGVYSLKLRFRSNFLVLLYIAAAAVAQNGPPNEGVLRLNPALDKLVPRGANVEQLASQFKKSEGPVWVHNGGYLLLSDLNEILKWTPAGVSTFRANTFKAPVPEGVRVGTNGLTFDRKGRLIACEHGDRRIVRFDNDGTTTVLADRYEGKRLNSPNDLVVRRKTGDVYFTDPGYFTNLNISDPDGLFRKDLNLSGVYRVSAAGKLELLIQNLPYPNGIAFSPDESRLYVSNSRPEKTWRVYDVAGDGSLRNGRLFFDATKLPGNGGPDGMKVDKAGNLYATGPRHLDHFAARRTSGHHSAS